MPVPEMVIISGLFKRNTFCPVAVEERPFLADPAIWKRTVTRRSMWSFHGLENAAVLFAVNRSGIGQFGCRSAVLRTCCRGFRARAADCLANHFLAYPVPAHIFTYFICSAGRPFRRLDAPGNSYSNYYQYQKRPKNESSHIYNHVRSFINPCFPFGENRKMVFRWKKQAARNQGKAL